MFQHSPELSEMGACMIGDCFILKVDCLGNKAGAMGYVFNEYKDFDDPTKIGVQIIFPNGNYDGFGWKEQQEFLKWIGRSEKHSNYQFRNVMQVSRDFEQGYWSFSKETK